MSVVMMALHRTSSLIFFLACLTATAVILERWEATLTRDVELTFFVPLMIGHGGNTGGTVVGSVVAGLNKGNFLSTLRRELLTALIVGTLLAALASFLPLGRTATVVKLALLVITLISALIGAVVPHLLKYLNMDAATIAPPAVTTLIDALGLVAYLTIADTFLS